MMAADDEASTGERFEPGSTSDRAGSTPGAAADARIGVFIVEDEPRVTADIVHAVSGAPGVRVVGCAATLAEARAALPRVRPDILLTDLQLPDGDGATLIAQVRAESLARAILVFTVFGEEAHVLRAIEAGADGYLLKGGVSMDLVAAFAQVLAGGSPISPPIARHLLRRVRDAEAHAPAAAGPAIVEPAAPVPGGEPLSTREIEVLRLVARGFIAEEVAERLRISVHTVRTHIRNVYGKLRVSRRVHAVAEAHRRGYL